MEHASHISAKRDEVLAKYKAYKDGLENCRKQLGGLQFHQQFTVDADELERWIGDRMTTACDNSWKNKDNLEGYLQKQSALEAEVEANEPTLKKLNSDGAEIIEKNSFPSKDVVETRLLDINHQWNELLIALKHKASSLQQAIALKAFLQRCNEVLYWIKDKETIVTSQDTGNDLSHVTMLRGKFDEFTNEIQAYKDCVKEVDDEADRLVSVEKHPENDKILEKQREVDEAWVKLNELADRRNTQLKQAQEVHAFKRDVEEAKSWMKEKEDLLKSNDLGSDVASVQALQRRHEGIERDLAALSGKVQQLCDEAERMTRDHVGDAADPSNVLELRDEMMKNWDHVSDVAKNRKASLGSSFRVERFLFDCNELQSWSVNVEHRMKNDELCNSVSGAEALVDKHQEHQGEIGAQESTFSDVIERGKILLDESKHRKSESLSSESSSSSDSSDDSDDRQESSTSRAQHEQIARALDEVKQCRSRVLEVWKERHVLYDQCLHLALFTRDAEQAESWMNTQEALLVQDSLGDSLDTVQGLISKHDDFVKSVEAQEEKIASVSDVALRLVDKQHYASDAIERRRVALLDRHSALRAGMRHRKMALEEAYKARLFERNANSIRAWIDEKMKIALDDSYKDAVNVLAKLQRHVVFDDEVRSSGNHVQAVLDEAERLLDQDHSESTAIRERCAEMKDAWDKLLEQCRVKGEQLEAAHAEQKFNRTVSDLHHWMSDVQSALTSQDEGSDVPSVSALVKKHQLLEVDVQMHKERIDGVELQADQFVADQHFNCDAIKTKQQDLCKSYDKLQEPLQLRNQRLSESLKSKCLLRDMQDEIEWLNDKFLITSSATIGKDLTSVRNLARKHKILMSEISAHEQQILNVCEQANQLIQEGNRDGPKIDVEREKMLKKWVELQDSAASRDRLLKSAIQSQEYLDNANDARAWIDEKKMILSSHEIGRSEDAAESLLRKHDALMTDVDLYATTVENLKQEADACELQSPMDRSSSRDLVLVGSDYKAKQPRELSVREGETLTLLSSYNKEWWKVENEAGKQGFVPASHLSLLGEEDREEESSPSPNITLRDTQANLEEEYGRLKLSGAERRVELDRSLRKFALVRECDDNLGWIRAQKDAAHRYQLDHHPEEEKEEIGLEEVEELQKQLDEFQKELKLSGKDIEKLNEQVDALNVALDTPTSVDDDDVTDDVSSDDDATPATAKTDDDRFVADKVNNLNEEWVGLQELINNLNENLGSAHQVHRFFRDANETHEWIEEKSTALDSDDVGSDLQSVQTLQRKHEGLERELAALGERIYSLDEDAANLSKLHPDQEEPIQSKRTEINQAWNDLVEKAKERKRCLSDSYELQRFLSDHEELDNWMDDVLAQVSSGELADSIANAETLLHRHQECRADIDGKSPAFHALEQQADVLVQAEHSSANQIDDTIQQVSHKREEIERAWASRRLLLEQCVKLHIFLRDCGNAENWMKAREDFLANDETGDSLDSVESLIKKHEDFDRAITIQQTKISAIQIAAERLFSCDPEHYAKALVGEKASDVEERWAKLKGALIDKRSKLGETQSLQQFSRDADEADAWMVDKLQHATDHSYKDPTNIQSKHQKHQAFEAELRTNGERIESIISAGQQLIDTHQCVDSEDAVKARIAQLSDEWKNLVEKSSEKGEKLRDANQQHNFVAAAKDLQFWISEVTTLLDAGDTGKDVPSVVKLVKKQTLMEADVAAHDELAKLLERNAHALLDKCADTDAVDADAVRSKLDDVTEKLAALKDAMKRRRSNLQQSLKIHQFFYDVTDEEKWINEKKLLLSSVDCGKDLTSVNGLIKKHRRLENESQSHQSNVDRLMEAGQELQQELEGEDSEAVASCMQRLDDNWKSLRQLWRTRSDRLNEAFAFQKFRFDLEEELSWLTIEQGVIKLQELPTSLVTSQKALSKHEAFEANLKVHHERIDSVERQGRELIDGGNPDAEEIAKELDSLLAKRTELDESRKERKRKLEEINKFLQFNWKADLIESWIGEKEAMLKNDVIGENHSSVQAQIVRMRTFEAGMNAFENEEIENISKLKAEIVTSDHTQAAEIEARSQEVMNKWDELKATARRRNATLEERQEGLREIDNLYLLFAKKASGFNSWFENVEEDLAEPIRCHSVAEIENLLAAHGDFCTTLAAAERELSELCAIDARLDELQHPGKDGGDPHVSTNPYTWFTAATLRETWRAVERMVEERNDDLGHELERQKNDDVLRREFAQRANLFHDWLKSTRVTMMSESGTLESQLNAIKNASTEIVDKRTDLSEIEELGTKLEEALILENQFTEHSTLGLAQQWDQLEQLTMRMQHNLEQQIQARNMTGVSEDALKEFSMMFKHFDKDQTGRLDHHEFKSCLRSLGYDLPMVDEGAEDPEFQAVLDMVDPNRDGTVSLQEYMTFMISRETDNVQSIEEVESAFRALSAEGKAYVTKDELYQNLSREQAKYCIENMPPYHDSHGIQVLGAFDYVSFTNKFFIN